MTFDHPPVYRTFILRFWEERNPDVEKESAWRFSLEDTETGVRHVFHDLDGVVAFIQKQTVPKS